MTNTFNRLLIASSVLAVIGCTPYSQQQPRPEPVPTEPAVTVPSTPAVVQPQPGVVPKPLPGASLNPAALSLARQARNQYLAQDYQGAIATAERGLRIERRAADLYLVLAQAYVQLAQPQKAEMFVQQGLRFAPQGSDVASGLLRVRESLGQ
ncbi:MAG TPA: tetratricopeptide repeat protein [Cellvibrio sp.]|nr:tetratricopeptide repeat protein [Cellvibrio sp.]